jgi:hypothetical protein
MAFYNLSITFEELKQWDEAKNAIEIRLRLDPDVPYFTIILRMFLR